MKTALIIVPVLVLLMVTGCGHKPPPGPAAHPVRGHVTYQGRPAAKFRVMLFPVTKWQGAQFAPSAVVDANGDFRIGSYKADDGAPAGEYAVTFTWPKHLNTAEDDSGDPEVDQLQGRYSDAARSTFHVTVREGDNELPPFTLK